MTGRLVSQLTIATMLLAIPVMGHAQVAASTGHAAPTTVPIASQNTGIGDIIVTARKRSESINKVPLSITAASGDQLRAIGVQSTSDLVKVVSGFQATQSQIGTPIYFLRGVGFSDISVSARPAVTIYADEAPLPYSVMSLGTNLDLERVEVLKGPQGLLFGSNSTGGAINFIAAKPTPTLEAGFDGSFSRFNQYSLSGFVSGPITDKIGVRVAVLHEGGDPWQYDYVDPRRKIGRKNVTSARIILEARPTDRLHLSLTAQRTVDESDPQMGQFFTYDANVAISPALIHYPAAPHNDQAAGFNVTGPLGQPYQRNNTQWQVTGRIDYELSDAVKITSLTSAAANHQEYAIDGDGTDIQVNGYGIHGDIHTFSQELRLTGSVGDHFSYILGGNYEHDRTQERDDISVVNAAAGNAFGALGLPPIDDVPIAVSTKYLSKAGFGNLDYKLSEKFTAHAGVRYTQTTTNFAGCGEEGTTVGAHTLIIGLGLNGIVSPGQCYSLNDIGGTFAPGLFVDKLPEHNISWKGGLDFKATAGTLIYVSASRGYKSGTYSAIPATLQSQFLPVPQERLTAYEVGVKSDIVPGILHVNAALFYYDYANKQLQGTVIVPPFGPIQRLVSIPKSRVQGAEFEMTLRPAAGVTLGGMVTYVDSKVTGNFLDFTRFGDPAQFRGSSFPDTPKWQAGANAEYRLPLSSSLNGYVGGNLTYRSKAYADFIKDDRLVEKAYTVVDARIGVQSSNKAWLFELFGHNIFNQYYWTSVLRPVESIYRYTGMPATYGARVSVRFQ